MSGLLGAARRLLGRADEPAQQAPPTGLGYGASPFVPLPVTTVRELADRRTATVEGTVRAVREAVGGTPRFVAELHDGTGRVDLVWLGRRRVQGVRPGSHLRAHGLVALCGPVPVVHNPRYEIVPPARPAQETP